jgi:hypothetical protein
MPRRRSHVVNGLVDLDLARIHPPTMSGLLGALSLPKKAANLQRHGSRRLGATIALS